MTLELEPDHARIGSGGDDEVVFERTPAPVKDEVHSGIQAPVGDA